MYTLDLSSNNLSGSISSSMGSFMPNLLMLDFSKNNLGGVIPISIFNVAASIDLSGNKLVGSIPSLGNRSSTIGIASLDLSDNLLTGNLPEFLNFSAVYCTYYMWGATL